MLPFRPAYVRNMYVLNTWVGDCLPLQSSILERWKIPFENDV